MLVCNHIGIHYTMNVSAKANYFAVSKRLGQFIILDENIYLHFHSLLVYVLYLNSIISAMSGWYVRGSYEGGGGGPDTFLPHF